VLHLVGQLHTLCHCPFGKDGTYVCNYHSFNERTSWILRLWFRASLIYINNCPTRCNTKQSIYYSASSPYMFRMSTTTITRSTQNYNYSLRYCAATSLQRGHASLATLEGGSCTKNMTSTRGGQWHSAQLHQFSTNGCSLDEKFQQFTVWYGFWSCEISVCFISKEATKFDRQLCSRMMNLEHEE